MCKPGEYQLGYTLEVNDIGFKFNKLTAILVSHPLSHFQSESNIFALPIVIVSRSLNA